MAKPIMLTQGFRNLEVGKEQTLLIKKVNYDEKFMRIKMTFTAPTCPMADEVLAQVKECVADVPGITGCEVELTFEPPWDQSMLSDEARVELGLD